MDAGRRSVVAGMNGAVATSQPLAAQAGLSVLQAGGNAVDAALAAAATLNVVEPMSTGLGGDVFALVYLAADRRVYALNGSGRAPWSATPEIFALRGLHAVPERGILSVTVPGAPAAWCDLPARFGRLPLERVLAPAIGYAEQGYPVSEYISHLWEVSEPLLQRDPESARVYLPGGHAPRPGEVVALPDLASTLRLLATQGTAPFYQGQVAHSIASRSAELGGLLSSQDLADHRSTWVEPISTLYRGYRVWECPPNAQGVATLLALSILSHDDLAAMPFYHAATAHLKMEAIKLAMVDAARFVADPAMASVPVEQLLSEAYASQRRALISADRAIALPAPWKLPGPSDTVYLAAADGQGNACSFISSLYRGFGSGITVPGTGITLQNRGRLFNLDPAHPNCLAPHKRPYHTIIPAMVTREDRLALCFGVMGGHMQPQGQVQVLCNMLDHGMSPQQALDAPRFFYHVGEGQGATFSIEPYYGEEVLASLRVRGHVISDEASTYGGGEVIMVDPQSGALLAGAEPRNDSTAVAY